MMGGGLVPLPGLLVCIAFHPFGSGTGAQARQYTWYAEITRVPRSVSEAEQSGQSIGTTGSPDVSPLPLAD
jgi:hypothetical protein